MTDEERFGDCLDALFDLQQKWVSATAKIPFAGPRYGVHARRFPGGGIGVTMEAHPTYCGYGREMSPSCARGLGKALIRAADAAAEAGAARDAGPTRPDALRAILSGHYGMDVPAAATWYDMVMLAQDHGLRVEIDAVTMAGCGFASDVVVMRWTVPRDDLKRIIGQGASYTWLGPDGEFVTWG